MFKLNKILLLILIFILFILLCNTKVFASFTFTYNNVEYTCPLDLPTTDAPYQLLMMSYNTRYGRYAMQFWYGSEPRGIIRRDYGNGEIEYSSSPNSNPSVSYFYNISYASSSPSWGNRLSSNGLNTSFVYITRNNNYQEAVFWSNYELKQFSSEGNCYNHYNDSSYYTILREAPESYNQLPYILNDTQSISLGGQNLIVMPGDFPNSKEIILQLQENNPEEIGAGIIQDNWTTSFSLSLDNQSQFYNPVDSSGVGFDYSIDWAYLSQYLSLSKQYKFNLIYTISGITYTETTVFIYGGSSPQEAIYNQGLQQQNTLNNINENMSDLNNSINNLESTITDDTVTSTASDLPSVNVNDPTQNGIDNIFQSIYNAFCTGQAQDIVFPIPFTNKNITLSPYYVRDMLNNNGANWVYLLIQAFWGYLIGRYIVKDISHKITKIKSGDVENIENNNIKEEML